MARFSASTSSPARQRAPQSRFDGISDPRGNAAAPLTGQGRTRFNSQSNGTHPGGRASRIISPWGGCQAAIDQVRRDVLAEGYEVLECGCSGIYAYCDFTNPNFEGGGGGDDLGECECKLKRSEIRCPGSSVSECTGMGFGGCKTIDCYREDGAWCDSAVACEKHLSKPGQTTDPSGSGDGSGDDTGGAGNPEGR